MAVGQNGVVDLDEAGARFARNASIPQFSLLGASRTASIEVGLIAGKCYAFARRTGAGSSFRATLHGSCLAKKRLSRTRMVRVAWNLLDVEGTGRPRIAKSNWPGACRLSSMASAP